MPAPIKVLLVEDSPDDESLLLRALSKGGLAVEHERVQTEEAMRRCLQQGPWDLVISDYSMPAFNGIRAYSVLRESGKDIPFIFVSGNLGEETAVEAMRLGVSDYFLKGNLKRLVPAIQRELRKMEDRRARGVAELALQSAEQQLMQAQKMEALGQLAGGVAHDFNNLLTVIYGYVEMLKTTKDDPAVMEKGLTEIRACADRAAALTRQLLAVGRRQHLKPKPTDLNASVEGVGRMLDRIIGEDVAVEYALEEGLPKVMADAGQLEQVLLNLAINARDAMPRGGKLRIETRAMVLSRSHLTGAPDIEPGRFALLAVCDSGQGMEAGLIDRIFEPFFTTKPEGKGTGLGLSTVYGIVKQSKGHIQVDSKLGEGTCFRVFLPIAEGMALPGVPGKSLDAELGLAGTGTVLLVEDEPALRGLVKAVLLHYGYEVIDTGDPEQALELGRRHAGAVDLLITDLTMPKMNGRQLAEQLASERPGLKVLFMTGYAMPTVAEELDRGDWMAKPFLPSEMLAKVQELLQRDA